MLKPLPKLTDEAALIKRGAESLLMSSRNNACESLRDLAVAVQSAPMHKIAERAKELQDVAERLIMLQAMWTEIGDAEHAD